MKTIACIFCLPKRICAWKFIHAWYKIEVKFFKKQSLAFSIFTVSSMFLYNANAQIVFQKTLSEISIGSFPDVGWSCEQTSDGGYIIAGNNVTKIDSLGNAIWANDYGGVFRSVQQTVDGGYILAGYIGSGAGERDVYLVKVNSIGDTIWAKAIGGDTTDVAYSVQQTTDTGYIITGSTQSYGAGKNDIYLIKTDNNGSIEWTKTFGGTENDFGYSVKQTLDSGYIITGAAISLGSGNFDVFLLKTDNTGDIVWAKTYGSNFLDDIGYSVQRTSDNGYVIAGYTDDFGMGIGGLYVIKTDSLGNIIWTKDYGKGGGDYNLGEGAKFISQTNDGGFIITGHTELLNPNVQLYLIKTDSIGDTLWTKVYDGSGGAIGYSVQQTDDGGYIVAGQTNNEVYLIKTDSNGNSGGCNVSASDITVSNTSTITDSATLLVDSGGVLKNSTPAVNNIQISACNSCSPLLVTYIIDTATAGNNDAAINITVTGGLPPYTYLWSNGASTEDIDSLVAGSYSLLLADSTACTYADTFTVFEIVGLVNIHFKSDFYFYPNPVNDKLIVGFNEITYGKDVLIKLYKIDGQLLYENTLKVTDARQHFPIDFSRYRNGIFFIQIITDETISIKKVIHQSKN